MIEGMEKYIGLKLSDEFLLNHKKSIDTLGYYLTRPDFYNGNTHINMFIRIDKDYRISGFDGNKCYSYSSSLYNRSAPVRKGAFTARDIAFLRKEVKRITE